jgi:hypothetical protein
MVLPYLYEYIIDHLKSITVLFHRGDPHGLFVILTRANTSLGYNQDLTCGYFHLAMQDHREGLYTIIINVTPSPWSRPWSSHEDLPMHANTHVHTHVFLLTFGPEFLPKMVVVIWLLIR